MVHACAAAVARLKRGRTYVERITYHIFLNKLSEAHAITRISCAGEKFGVWCSVVEFHDLCTEKISARERRGMLRW